MTRTPTLALPADLSEQDALHVAALVNRYVDQLKVNGRQPSPGLLILLAQVSARAMRVQDGSVFAQPSANGEAGLMTPELLSYDESAELLGSSRSSVKRRVADGVFTPVRLGRSVRLRRSDLTDFINAGKRCA